MKDLNQTKFSFTAKRQKLHWFTCVGVCYIFWWMNLIFIMLRIELQNKKTTFHLHTIRTFAVLCTLKCRLPPGNPRASKDLPKPLTSVALELTQKGVLVFRKKNKVNSWGSVSIICMYIDPLKKLRVSKAQKMCSANSFVDQGRFAGHILEWHILPKHVFFEFLDDPWPSCGDGTY